MRVLILFALLFSSCNNLFVSIDDTVHDELTLYVEQYFPGMDYGKYIEVNDNCTHIIVYIYDSLDTSLKCFFEDNSIDSENLVKNAKAFIYRMYLLEREEKSVAL